MKQKHWLRTYLILGIILVLCLGLYWYVRGLPKLPSVSLLRDLLLHLGGTGYFWFILILIISVPLPIPSEPIALVGGYVYGAMLGSILTLVGITLGSVITFYLVRIAGEPLVEKLVDRHHIIHFNHLFKKRGVNAALIGYAIPIFPSDALNLLLGLTPISVTTFIWVVVLGNIPRYLLLNSLGHDLQRGFSWTSAFIIAGVVLFLLIAILRERIKHLLFKELQKLEKDVGIKKRAISR